MLRRLNKKTTQHIPRYFSKQDIDLFKQGCHFALAKKLGAHLIKHQGQKGVHFAVWAPHAKRVSVFGDFNGWKKNENDLHARADGSGLWEGFVAGVQKGDQYKYRVHPKGWSKVLDKSDPFAFYSQIPSETASRVWSSDYTWHDQAWMKKREQKHQNQQAMSIYEVHLGSWCMHEEEQNRFFNYREMAEHLVPYVKRMGFTHIEFLPIMEHPYYGSWGYQTLGYFAPSARYGMPEDFKYLIDICHQNGIGVFLDWVPSHFPQDAHGLAKFDGKRLYETDEIHPDWQSCIFDVGQLQVKDFLISNALFWLEEFHVDGLRVDAVASMLYRDYSRGDRWQPNFFGGVENLESIAFLRELNQVVKDRRPDVMMMAEESTTWPNVSSTVDQGGLHFDMKWNLGWMHDTLEFFSKPISQRSKYLGQLTHCFSYAFSEKFLLTLSHDEVVHLKNSMLGRMPGTINEQLAHVRSLYAYMFAHPGKKLLFMGNEWAQQHEWDHESSLDWYLLEDERHEGVQNLIQALNQIYRREKALWSSDFEANQFQAIDVQNTKEGVISFLRCTKNKKEEVLIVLNYKSRYRKDFTIQLPAAGAYEEILNTDHQDFGGKHRVNEKLIKTKKKKNGNMLCMNVAPLSVLFLKKVSDV